MSAVSRTTEGRLFTDEAYQPTIVIVGAGQGSLSVAHFLKQAGYRNVTVFEKRGRVGGGAPFQWTTDPSIWGPTT